MEDNSLAILKGEVLLNSVAVWSLFFSTAEEVLLLPTEILHRCDGEESYQGQCSCTSLVASLSSQEDINFVAVYLGKRVSPD